MIKLFCKHDKEHIATEKNYPSRMHLFRCKKCGQLFYYDKFENRMLRIRHPEKYGDFVYD